MPQDPDPDLFGAILGSLLCILGLVGLLLLVWWLVPA